MHLCLLIVTLLDGQVTIHGFHVGKAMVPICASDATHRALQLTISLPSMEREGFLVGTWPNCAHLEWGDWSGSSSGHFILGSTQSLRARLKQLVWTLRCEALSYELLDAQHVGW